MTALYIILGIIAFFILVFSVPLHVSFEYSDYIYVSVRWLFIKIGILPLKPKKPKKQSDKPKKEKKPKKKKKPKPPKEEEEKPSEKKENPIITTIKNMGYDGVMEILSRLGHALKGMFRRIFKAFGIDYYFINISVGKGDAAETAIAYGKTCGEVFPVCGMICSCMRVKKYSVEVTPDFLANHNTADMGAEFYVVPQKLIHAFVVVGFELMFKVLLKFLFGSNKTKENNKKSKQSFNAE